MEIKMPSGFRQWCGTKQIQGEFDAEGFLRDLVESGRARFVVGQLEEGSHLHLQYYVQRDRQSTLTVMKRDICGESHWEPARGSPDQNIQYCTKASTRVAGPWQFGECNKQGQRTDIAKAAPCARSRSNVRRHLSSSIRVYVHMKRSLAPRAHKPSVPRGRRCGYTGARRVPGSHAGRSSNGPTPTAR